MTIDQTLQRMMQKTVAVQEMNISQAKKDEIKRIMNNALDFVIEQTEQTTINRLVYDEVKKKKFRESHT